MSRWGRHARDVAGNTQSLGDNSIHKIPIHTVAEASISRQRAYRGDSIGRQPVDIRVHFEKHAGILLREEHRLVDGSNGATLRKA